jgi:hypothetical protein
MNPTDRPRLIEAMVARYRATLERQLLRDPQTLEQIEQMVEDVSREMDAELEQAILDHTPPPPENQARCPQCGQAARYRATYPRVLITRHGERLLTRRYYYCRDCAHGFAPLDALLGLDAGATSPAVRQAVAQLAAHLSFAAAARLLEELTGLPVGESTVERLAVGVGSALRQAQREEAVQHHAGRGPAVDEKPWRLYVSVDGIHAPLREPWKRDGSLGELVCRFGECKTAVVYAARPGEQGDAGVQWREYTATFEDVRAFGPLVATLAHRCGHHFARALIFLADGQAYNWTLAATHFPTAIQIVDFMHAVEHLYRVAQTVWGEGNAAVAPWVAARREELLADQVTAVLAAIRALPAQTPEQEKVQASTWGYFANNAERMRYQSFRERGYQIATGVMEAGCKQVVHQRLDQVGMHWRPETAEAMVALRAALLSDHPPDLRPYCRAVH